MSRTGRIDVGANRDFHVGRPEQGPYIPTSILDEQISSLHGRPQNQDMESPRTTVR
jgi:hypothetical protein